ncbi:urea amidolyase, putative [Talaromyces stipitatus ATCC 10500]|uniref:Urea amidolyase, putative n=1 Tax=Talaromyces stipitatus (strain ATCC 10500 / CBS 375.48 / QM 6759 / NRRL 1006) TaxID=441959 RepID=B8LZW5_TALSN|nr:urea amidolyase, putative [Talaromyces stipitatus ATCC 10500]EED20897.1 urea amidolyase, putative [Talaromyces stipitatus ATCC 10500]
MEKLQTLLIANRGEIAVRISKTARELGVRTIAIYTKADSTSRHVSVADEAVLLPGEDATAYTDGDAIIEIARSRNVDAIIPGYGFLSENANFAHAVASAGMVFVGPKHDAIEAFGLKHRAREMAIEAGVPIVPGTGGLLATEDDAVSAADELGYPVMLKATGGGGGMGLVICNSPSEVRDALAQVRSRGAALFKNAGVFLERYYAKSHHIEVQVFGNGLGNAIHFGERECSIQRRHQKVVEECPSPFVDKNPDLRRRLTSAAVALAESVKYASAGTVEYLVDDVSGDFFFLEMNTRLQVEHGITELCYGVDLVKLMLEQADRELAGQGGIDGKYLKSQQPELPVGVAIEVRVYAENPARNYTPSPGFLQYIQWAELEGTRIDTWVGTGARISTFYDPMIAKVMVHASGRNEAIEKFGCVLSQSIICGPPTNLDFLHAIVQSAGFKSGHTLTNFLENFEYSPTAIDVISPGVYTTLQDFPGRPNAGQGIPHAGPMDPLAFQVGNLLVGNPRNTEGLEITLRGPELRFLAPAVVSVCGAPITLTLDGVDVPMWTRLYIKHGQVLSIGKLLETGGCRAYLAVFGGFPAIAQYFGSKSTTPLLGIGGYQGRALAPGDLLTVQKVDDFNESASVVSLPQSLRPKYTNHWDIYAMVGPYDEGYMGAEDIEMIYNTIWKVSHNATRGGIRLIGPAPTKWARKDGGEGGQHPSNVIEYGYPLGTLNWTGESPCIFPVDAPDLGGFLSSTTIVKGSLWRLGQVKSGDTIQYRRISLEDALWIAAQLEKFLDDVASFVVGKRQIDEIEPVDGRSLLESTVSGNFGKAVIYEKVLEGSNLKITFRQGGDDFLLVEYGDGGFDLNNRCRVTSLEKVLRKSCEVDQIFKNGIYKTIGCCNSLLVHYDGLKLPRKKLMDLLISSQSEIGDLSSSKVPSRRFRLPICFESPAQQEAIQRYMETQRPYAPFLPDNMDFVAKINGITYDELVRVFLTTEFMVICVGFFCADTICLPIDPRYRLTCPKQNPSRVYTPEGSVSWGGSCMNIYPVDSPGGYQLTGQTIPCFDQLGIKPGFASGQPGLFRDFDQVTFYRVDKQEFERDMALFRSGRYEFKIEEDVFDMGAHNKLLLETREEVSLFKSRQLAAQAEMLALEKASMERWMAEKSKNTTPADELEILKQDPNNLTLDSPLDANVWKVNVNEGQLLSANQVAVILEAMKMEISVSYKKEAADTQLKVIKVLVQPGDTVKAGDTLMFVREL